MSFRPSFRSLTAPAIVLLWSLSLALPAQAGRFSQGTFTGQRGGSGTYSRQIDRTPGQVNRDTSVTGSQGACGSAVATLATIRPRAPGNVRSPARGAIPAQAAAATTARTKPIPAP